MPRVLAIIITYNAEQWLPVCLGSIQQISDLVDLALVDNNSLDRTVSMIQEQYADHVQYPFYLDQNLGFGKAHNLIFQSDFAAAYDYFLLLNQDASIDRSHFKLLVDQAEQDKSYAILSPLHFWNNEILDKNFASYYDKATLDPANSGILALPFVNAAIWLLRAGPTLEVNGFHPIFPHYGEDRNLVDRFQVLGWKIGVVPEAKGYHYRAQKESKHWLTSTPYRLMISTLAIIYNPNNSRWSALIRFLYNYCRVLLYNLVKLEVRHFRDNLINLFKLLYLYAKSLREDLIYVDNRQGLSSF